MRETFGIMVLMVAVLGGAAVSASGLPAETAAAAERQIREALAAEQEAFVGKGCEAALAFFGEREPLFVSSGRTLANKAAVRSACGSRSTTVPRREVQGHQVQVLSPTTGYSVTTYRGGSEKTQVVTKIWEKGTDGWRIVHAHESAR